MSKYILKPKKQHQDKTISVGFDNYYFPSCFIQVCCGDDYILDMVSTGSKICAKIKEYCDLDDDLTFRVFHDILLDIDPSTLVLDEYVEWFYYREQ